MKGESELTKILDDLDLDYEETEVDVSDELRDSEKFQALRSFYKNGDLQFTVFEGENPEFNAIGLTLTVEDIFDFSEIKALKKVLEDIKELVDNIPNYKIQEQKE